MGEHKHNDFVILLRLAVHLVLEPFQVLSMACHWPFCHQTHILCLRLLLYCCLVHVVFSLNFVMKRMPHCLYVKQLDCQ